MPGKQVITFWDYDSESSHVTVPTVEIDETNLVAQDALMDAFFTALGGITLGIAYKDVRAFKDDLIAGAAPNDDQAQREKKFLVRMHEDAHPWTKHTMEIPTADTAQLDVDNRGNLKIDAGVGAAFVSALEALYEPDSGNNIVVDEVVFTGRNL